MTNTIPDTGIDDDINVETCLQQLGDPAVLLADALYRIHRADAAQIEIDHLAVPVTEADVNEGMALLARQDHLIRTADSLAYIAKTAAGLSGARPLTEDDLDAMAMQPSPNSPASEHKPQPVNGVRFTVELTGHYLGIVAGRKWLHVPGHGFLDVSHAAGRDGRYILTGRVVSATPDHALCVLDGGLSVTLPRALLIESADE